MKLTITTKQERPLLARKEIKAELTYEKKATPTKKEIKKEIAMIEKSPEELIIIKKIKTEYGKGKANITAHIYTDKEKMLKIEEEAKKQAEKEAEETKKAAAEAPAEPAEEKKEEATPEQKAEEKPAEEKKE